MPSELGYRGNLDEKSLPAGGIKIHLSDALGTLATDLEDTTLTEIIVFNAVPRDQSQITVVADARGNAIRPRRRLFRRGRQLITHGQ